MTDAMHVALIPLAAIVAVFVFSVIIGCLLRP
jgi:hypothetical protein